MYFYRQKKTPPGSDGVKIVGGTLWVNLLPVWTEVWGRLTPRFIAAMPLYLLVKCTSYRQPNALTARLKPGRTPGGKPLGRDFAGPKPGVSPAGECGSHAGRRSAG